MYNILFIFSPSSTMASAHKQQTQEKDYFRLLQNNPTNNIPLKTEQYSLLFANDVLLLVDLLHNKPHDIDKVRYRLLSSFENLVLSLGSRGAITDYHPKAKLMQYKRPLQVLRNLLTITAKNIMALNLTGERITHNHNVVYIHQLLDDHYNLVLELTGYTDLTTVVIRTLEYKLHWQKLKEQRDLFIKKWPFWKYHIESVSLFPLLYKLQPDNSSATGLCKLLTQCEVRHVSEVPLPITAVRYFVTMATHHLRTKIRMSEVRTATLIAEATRLKASDFRTAPTDDLTLIIPTFYGTTPPTFEEQWKYMGDQPQLPASPRKTNLQILQNITNKHKKPVTSRPTAVITGSRVPHTVSKPMDIPKATYQPTCEDITPPTESLKLYSEATKENIEQPAEYRQMVTDALGPEYLESTTPAATAVEWHLRANSDDSGYLSEFTLVNNDGNYVSDPLLLNAHSAYHNDST